MLKLWNTFWNCLKKINKIILIYVMEIYKSNNKVITYIKNSYRNGFNRYRLSTNLQRKRWERLALSPRQEFNVNNAQLPIDWLTVRVKLESSKTTGLERFRADLSKPLSQWSVKFRANSNKKWKFSEIIGLRTWLFAFDTVIYN